MSFFCERCSTRLEGGVCPACGHDTRAPVGSSELPDDMPHAMRVALEEQSPELRAEIAMRWLVADEDGRADMAAFFEGDGPRAVREMKIKIENGTPTSRDIERWLSG